MNIGIMQPYLFPYYLYFKLIKKCDKFVFLDDVDFIKRGWINRNQISDHLNAKTFTIPCVKSRFQKINTVEICPESSPYQKTKLLKRFNQNFKSCKNFDKANNILNKTLEFNTNFISELAIHSIKEVCKYLDIETDFSCSSNLNLSPDLSGENRIIKICQILGGEVYYNLPGGKSYYNDRSFIDNGLRIKFIEDSILNPDDEKVFQMSIIEPIAIYDLSYIQKKL